MNPFADRYRAAVAGASDPAAAEVLRRVHDTLDRAVHPLSGREVRRRTRGGDLEVQAAIRALTDAGLLWATPRRGNGGGTNYALHPHPNKGEPMIPFTMTQPQGPTIHTGTVTVTTDTYTRDVRVDVIKTAGGIRYYRVPDLEVTFTEEEAEHMGGGFDLLVDAARITPVQSITVEYL